MERALARVAPGSSVEDGWAVNAEPIPPRPDGTSPSEAPGPTPSRLGATRLADRPAVTWTWWEAVGVYLGAFLVAGFATLPIFRLLDDEDLATIVGSLVASLVAVGIVLLWLGRLHPGWRREMGFPDRWGPDVRAGIIFGIGLYPVVVVGVGLLLTLLFQLLSGETVQAPEQVPQGLTPIGVATTLLYGVVVAPLAEELFFRGVLFRAVRDRHGFWAGALASGVAFGLIHYIPGPAIDALLLMSVMVFTGIGFAYIYERRGTIVAPVVAHATFNVIGLSLIYAIR
jgi:membrane protease YdiL (CAAX protease family)